jgi:hypothetical protein
MQKERAMITLPAGLERRTLLRGAAGLIVAAMGADLMAATPASIGAPGPGAITGTGPGDFDFLTGEWTIRLRNFDTSKPGGDKVRDASATVHRVLNGAASIEELRNGDGSIWGMGVRVWHPKEGRWADHWTSGQDGVVNPPQLGRFIDGAGVFLADDEDDGKPVKIKAVWDRITPASCRWYQIMSRDGGKTWEYGWYMDWARVA